MDAIDQFSRAVDLIPDDYNSFVYLGRALSYQGFFEDAVESFQRALEIKPQDGLPYFNMSLVLYRQGKYDEAVEMNKKGSDMVKKNSLSRKIAQELLYKEICEIEKQLSLMNTKEKKNHLSNHLQVIKFGIEEALIDLLQEGEATN